MMKLQNLAALFAAVMIVTGDGLAQQRGDAYVVILQDPAVAEKIASRKELGGRAAGDYRAALAAKQDGLRAAVAETGVKVVDQTQVLLNALYVVANADQAEALRGMDGVARVQKMYPIRRRMNKALDLVNAPAAWNLSGGRANAGAGVKIAILDTGVDQEHPAFKGFSTAMPAGYPKCRTDNGDCNFTNNKVVAARSYVDLLNFFYGTNPADTRPDDNSPRDRIGHGTASAMVAAGIEHDSPVGRLSGVAPGALIGNYKVFGSKGVNDTTYLNAVTKALEEAIADGMDIATLNLGSPAGYGAGDNFCGTNKNQPCEAMAAAVENAVRLGLVVTTVAGNSGTLGANTPSLNTIETPGIAPSAITVGAVTNSHIWYQTLAVQGNGVPAELLNINARLSDGPQLTAALQAPVTEVGSVGRDRLACDPLPDGSLNGRWALIDRGTCPTARKINNASRAGALGVILVGFSGDGVFLLSGMTQTSIPSVLIGFNAGASLRAFLSGNADRELRFNPAYREVAAPADEIAYFSSQGPAIGDFGVKPELVAVGSDMYMATQKFDPAGEMYSATGFTVAEGTSFASPMAAGAAALVKQRSSVYTPGVVKSLVVNTATGPLTDFDNNGRSVTAAVTAAGAGKLNAQRALQATVAVEPSAVAFGVIGTGALPSRGLVVTNLATGAVNLSVRVDQRTPDSVARVTVVPATFSLTPGRSTQLNVQLTGGRPRAGQYDGALVITGGGAELRVPYTYFVGDGVPYNMYSLAGGAFEAIPNTEFRGILMKVVDQFGVPVQGAALRGTMTSGTGRISFANERTDEYGIAEAYFDPGASTGQNVIRFSTGNIFTEFVGQTRLRPTIAGGGVRDAASGDASTGFAAGQYISIFGSGLADTLKVFSGSELPLSIAATSVSFDNEAARVSVPGRLQFVSAGQVNVQIPWEVEGLATVDIKVSIGEFSSIVLRLPLRKANPSFFEYFEAGSNRRYAAALDGGFRVLSTANPVLRGQVAQLYLNGLGPVDTKVGSGQVAGANPLSRTVDLPEVRIGGRPAQVLFSGLAPGIVGLYQVNVVVPNDAPTGTDVEVTLRQSGVDSRTTRIPVQ
jgi:minor extracellular serine protease Vpr